MTFTATISVASPGSTAAAYPDRNCDLLRQRNIDRHRHAVRRERPRCGDVHHQRFEHRHRIRSRRPTPAATATSTRAPSPRRISQVVNKDGTTTTAAASPSSANLGQTITFTATVAANSPGSGTPTGTWDFYDTTTSTDLTPGGVALSSGTASFATTSLAAGPHTIKATYSGDGNFVTSYGTSGTVTVGQSIIVLDPSAGEALSISGNASDQLAGRGLRRFELVNRTVGPRQCRDQGDGHRRARRRFQERQRQLQPGADHRRGRRCRPLCVAGLSQHVGTDHYGSESISGDSSVTIKPGIYSGIFGFGQRHANHESPGPT